MTHQALLLFTITGWHIFFGALLIFVVFGIIYQFSVKNKFNRLDVELNGMVNVRTSKISSITTIINQSIQTVKAGQSYAEKITDLIIKGRVPGPSEMVRVFTEAGVPINVNLFTDLLPSIQGLWSQLHENEIAIQSVLQTRNAMLVTVPEKWFLSGVERLIPPIVTSEATQMVQSGVLTPGEKLFD